MRGERLKNKIKGQLALGHLEEALRTGLRYIDNDIIVVLSGQFYSNRRDYRNGFIVNNRFNVVRNRITLAYLQLLKDDTAIVPTKEHRRIWKPRRLFYLLFLPFVDFAKLQQLTSLSWVLLGAAASVFVLNEIIDFPGKVALGDNTIQVNMPIPNIAPAETAPPPQPTRTTREERSDPDNGSSGDVPSAVVSPDAEEVVEGNDPDGDDRREAEQERERQRLLAEAEARRQAEAAAAERSRREREAAASRRAGIGGLFGNDSPTTSRGDEGNADGDPNSDNLSGSSTGSGTVGSGLSNRAVSSRPPMVDNSQSTGTVVVQICVTADGRVDASSAQITLRGTTTTDSQLQSVAIRNAKQWRFEAAEVDRQCGTITYNFKVR